MTSPLEAYLRDNPQFRSRNRGELLNELFQTSGVQEDQKDFERKLLRDPENLPLAERWEKGAQQIGGKVLKGALDLEEIAKSPKDVGKGVVRGLGETVAGALDTGQAVVKQLGVPEGNPFDLQVPEYLRDPGRFAKWLREQLPTTHNKIAGGAGYFVGAAPGEAFQFIRGKSLWAAARGLEFAERYAKEKGPNRPTTGLDIPEVARDASEWLGVSLPERFGESWAKKITPGSWHEVPPGGGATTWEKLRDASAGAVANAYILWTARVFKPQQWLQQSWRTGMAMGEQDLFQGKGYDEGLFNFGMSFVIGAAAGKFSANAQRAYDEAVAAAARGDGKGAMHHLDELLRDENVALAVSQAARTRTAATAASEGKLSERQLTVNREYASVEQEMHTLELQRADIIRRLQSETMTPEARAQLEQQHQALEQQYETTVAKAHDLSWERYVPKHEEYVAQGPMPPVPYSDRLSRWTAMERSEATLASSIDMMQRRNAQRTQFLEQSEELFKGVSGAEREAMMTAFMRGEVDKIPAQYRPWFSEATKINEELYAGERGSEINYEYRQNYFHLQWREKQQAKARAHANARPRFQKGKVFEDVEEGRAAGFELKSTNPAVLLAWRIEASNMSRAKVDAMHFLVEDGLAVPHDMMPVITPQPGPNVGPNARPSRPEAFEGWKDHDIGGKKYWVHPDAWSYYERAFNLDKIPIANFWRVMEGGATDRSMQALGSAWMTLRNAMIPMKLSLSGFHAHHMVGIWTVANKVPIITALANKRATFDDFIKAAQDTDRLGSYAAGARAYENFRRPYHELSPLEQTQQDMLVMMGMNPAQPDVYRLRAARAFRRTVNDELPRYYAMWEDEGFVNKMASSWGVGKESAKAVGISIGRMIEKMQEPLFNDWIPRVKTQAALNEATMLLSTKPELLANTREAQAQLRYEMTRIRKNIDDRFGEMQYEKAFWPSWLKRALQGSMLSVGWNFSGARMFVGGMQDMMRVEQRGLSFKGVGVGATKEKIRETGDMVTGWPPEKTEIPAYGEITSRMAFGGMYVGYAMLQNVLLTMINTGRVEGVKDAFYPKDTLGGRLNTPYQTRLFGEIYYHTRNEGVIAGMEKLGYSKLNSPAQGIIEVLQNKNYFNNDVRDPLGTPTEQIVQSAKHFAVTAMAPISWQSTVGRGVQDPRMWGLAVGGYNPAPSYTEYTPFEARVNDLFEHYHPGFITSKAYDELDKNELAREMGKAFKKANQSSNATDWARYDQLVREYEKAYPWRLNKGAVRTTREKRWAGPRMAYKWSQLTEAQQQKLLDAASPEERKLYGPWSHPIVRDKGGWETPDKFVRPPSKENKPESPSQYNEVLESLRAKPDSLLRVEPPDDAFKNWKPSWER